MSVERTTLSRGRTFLILGETVTIRVESRGTGGAYALFETQTPPRHEVPNHLQRYDDEAFLVLEGRYTFQIGDDTIELAPRDYVFVPRGTPHAHANNGTTPARMLIIASPGNIHEQFIAELGVPVENPNIQLLPATIQDVSWLAISAEKYGIEIKPPPSE